MATLTCILDEARAGDSESCAQLSALLYEELHKIARREMAGERAEHTLQPTALMHEAYLRLVADGGGSFENRAHFLGSAAIAIRRILVEHARRRARIKRGGGCARLDLGDLDLGDLDLDLGDLDLGDLDPAAPVPDESLIELDGVLVELAEFAPRHARIVELRFFAGMTLPEIAELLCTSESTIGREWRLARAWLRGRLEGCNGS